MKSDLAHYFVTDVETDGPNPSEHSMLSFATVVVREDGEMCGEFETNLVPRQDRQPDPETMAWWKTQPEAFAALKQNVEGPEEAMPRFAAWVKGFPEKRSFAARPLLFDGLWIDRYCRDFADSYILDDPHGKNNIFTTGNLDIGSYMSGVFGRTDPRTGWEKFPASWLGNHAHSHRAIDDSRGYANVLAKLLKLAASQPNHPEDFLGSCQ